MPNLYSISDCEEFGISEVHELYRKHVNPSQVDIFSSFEFGRQIFSRAEGMYIYTNEGRKILDFTGGLGVLSHGHNHPRILAVREKFQRDRKMEVHKIVFSPYVAALSHNIAALLPGDLNKCFFPNSGAEAVEGALKIAFKAHANKKPRGYVLHSDTSFHGKLIGSGTISGSQESVFDFPKMQDTGAFKVNNLSSVETLVSNLRHADGVSNVYAIIVEPFNATTMLACSPEFLAGLRDICDRENIFLIFDVVFSGWGKCGQLFYFMESGILPDVLTMSKSFGGGKASISAFVCTDYLFKSAYGSDNDALLHTSTYNGFGEECATALEAVNIIVEEDYPARSRHIHEYLHTGFKKLQQKYPKAISDVRGAGALNGIVVASPFAIIEKALSAFPVVFKNKTAFINKVTAASIMDELFSSHDILTMMSENKDTVLLSAMPSLIAEDRELDMFLNGLDAVLDRGLSRIVGAFVGSKLKQILRAGD
jgi:putrescine aminotransferase